MNHHHHHHIIVNSKIFWFHNLRRRRSRTQLLDDLKTVKRYWNLSEEALDPHFLENLLWKNLWTCRKTQQATIDSVSVQISQTTNSTKHHGLRNLIFFQEPPMKVLRPDVRGWPIYDDSDAVWGHTHRAVCVEKWVPYHDLDNWTYTSKIKHIWVSIYWQAMDNHNKQRLTNLSFVIGSLFWLLLFV